MSSNSGPPLLFHHHHFNKYSSRVCSNRPVGICRFVFAGVCLADTCAWLPCFLDSKIAFENTRLVRNVWDSVNFAFVKATVCTEGLAFHDLPKKYFVKGGFQSFSFENDIRKHQALSAESLGPCQQKLSGNVQQQAPCRKSCFHTTTSPWNATMSHVLR